MRLNGLSLCESLFFLGHDPFNGKARIRGGLLDIGLSATILADLLFDERITLDHGTVVLISRYATGEPIADRMLARIMAETEQHGIRDWVEHLADGIFDTVVENLTVRELVTPKEKRGMFRHSLHYQPADLRTASAPRAMIRSAMLGQNRCDLPTATLAVLAWTVGLDDICEPELSRKQSTDWIERVKSVIVQPFRGLVSGTDAAVAAAVYGGNRS
ncbi:GPP34 family phosphoprotein [Kibdelosporangium philippinense]|uniref:GPP34 family phosphoprotein n=1 Tax=Kibdelosporangium philippinense TaxID=211113 RepID=A0ABS8Z5U4_9PSEU|nr:GPP34 family phosphoprotein [Kibdelosporangium philippinense]MCE7001242.1 GPP34 family phosphoprotein [Kibdelosporangium philippinense]